MKKLILLTCVGSLALTLAAGAADEPNNNVSKKGKGSANTAAAVQKGPRTVAHPMTNTQLRTRRTYSNVPLGTTGGNHADVTFRRNQSLNVHNNLDVNVHNNQKFHQNIANARVRNTHVNITNNWKGQNFSNQKYAAFRNYHRESHDRDWWRHNHSRIVFYFGAPYYWDSGYWYPAWGYNPGFTYDYDGPIYGYNGLAPDQVLTTVQGRLQEEGYYQGAVDGTMGPLTRQALADFQSDHGLAVTAAVDEPTMAAMGLS